MWSSPEGRGGQEGSTTCFMGRVARGGRAAHAVAPGSAGHQDAAIGFRVQFVVIGFRVQFGERQSPSCCSIEQEVTLRATSLPDSCERPLPRQP